MSSSNLTILPNRFQGVFLILTLLVCFSIPGLSQNKISYGGMQQFSLAFSQEEIQPFITLTNGIRYKQYFLGIGWTYEGMFMNKDIRPLYGMQSYIDGRYYIGKRQRLFTLLNAGLNTHIEKYKDWNWARQRSSYKFKPGYYASTGFGIRAKIGKELFYSLDLSYNWKQTRYEYTYTNFLNKITTEYHNIRQSRILFKLGFELF